jgi:hypothetical protein
VRGGARIGDQLERLAQSQVGAEAVDQHLRDLPTRYDPIATVPACRRSPCSRTSQC